MTDITYIKTVEGWLHLAIVLDLYSRQVVGWSMQLRMHTGLLLDALLMAVWRRKPAARLILHPDQGSQFNKERPLPPLFHKIWAEEAHRLHMLVRRGPHLVFRDHRS